MYNFIFSPINNMQNIFLNVFYNTCNNNYCSGLIEIPIIILRYKKNYRIYTEIIREGKEYTPPYFYFF